MTGQVFFRIRTNLQTPAAEKEGSAVLKNVDSGPWGLSYGEQVVHEACQPNDMPIDVQSMLLCVLLRLLSMRGL